MKICIQGDKKAGKTYYIKNNFKTNAAGIITRRCKSGVIIGYMENHKIIKWKKCGRIINNKMTAITEAFETFGVNIIKNLMTSDKTIIIDEIGFLELNAPNYCAYLKKLFTNKKNIVVALRNESNELIDFFKNHKAVKIVTVKYSVEV